MPAPASQLLDETASVLAGTSWRVRVAVSLVTAAAVLVAAGAHRAGAVVQVAIAALALAAWWCAERQPRARTWAAWAVPLALAVLAAVGGVTATADHQVIGIGFAVSATIAAATEHRARTLLLVLAAGVLGIALGAIAYNNASAASVLGLPAVLGAAALTGRYRRSYRVLAERTQALLTASEHARAEREGTVALAERARIAREIHDVLAHSLGALGIQLQTVEAVLTDRGDVAGALERLARAQRLVAEGLEETGRAVHALRSDTPPLPESLAAMTPPSGALIVAGTPFALSPAANLALLRVGQEALVNVRKHARGRPAAVRLACSDKAVELTISSILAPAPDAPPPVPTVAGGYGLAGMHERLRLIDGSLSAGPAGARWVVRARVPR